MEISTLLNAARAVRENAHAPYSHFKVGAALCSENQVFVGCNVENLSFGLTMCAERVALGLAIASGVKTFEALALISDSKLPVAPCGACRQVLAEFSPNLRIVSETMTGEREEWFLNHLFPHPSQGILG